MRSRRFRSELGDTVAELLLADDQATVGERSFSYSLEQLSEWRYHLLLDGRSYTVSLTPAGDHTFRVSVNGKSSQLIVKSERDILLEDYGLEQSERGTDLAIRAPMPGLVLSTLVSEGDSVKRGDGLLVLEAMKMENEIRSMADGTVKRVHVVAGDAVAKDAVLVELE